MIVFQNAFYFPDSERYAAEFGAAPRGTAQFGAPRSALDFAATRIQARARGVRARAQNVEMHEKLAALGGRYTLRFVHGRRKALDVTQRLPDESKKFGRLNLVDLAGSENVGR